MATKLHSDLNKPGSGGGPTCWLDVEMRDKSEAAMREGVMNCQVVLAIITDDGGEGNSYFERPFCLEELKWAQEGGIFIQPVVAVDDKQRIGELLAKAPSDLRELLGRTDFIHLDRGDREYWQVGISKILRVLQGKKAQTKWQSAYQKVTSSNAGAAPSPQLSPHGETLPPPPPPPPPAEGDLFRAFSL